MLERAKRLLYPLGHYIKQSVALFFSGLVLFGAGLALLWHNPSEDSWLGYSAIIIIVVAITLGLIGWLGILAYRLSHIINNIEQSKQSLSKK
tara:strand:+ start:217 stop:492 length:276 start_codon:yes stop_codon:yes gene_type:complete